MRSPNARVARWLEVKRDRGCLPATIAQYSWVAQRALGRLKTHRRSLNPARWSREDARFLRLELKDDPWQLAIVADLAKFHRNPVFQEVGLPRRGPTTRVRWLSEEQIRVALEETRDNPLLRVVALLGLGQGLRRIEWLRMRAEDLDLENQRMLVRGKGRGHPKLVWMPMHPALPAALREYLTQREKVLRRGRRRTPGAPVPPELLVHWRGGRPVPYGAGGANRWMRVIERRLRARGFAVKLSSHMLRRSAATLLERTLLRSPQASRDGVYRSIQEFLRHENLATTMRYLDSDPSRQRRAMEAFARALDWMDTPSVVHLSKRRPGRGIRLRGLIAPPLR